MTVKPYANWSRRRRAQDVDRHVADAIRRRRVALDITQQQLADAIGVTYQQAHKYERAVNRITAGRLARIAAVLGTDPADFFSGLDGDGHPVPIGADPESLRLMLALTRTFLDIREQHLREAVLVLSRALAGEDKVQ